MSVLAAPLAEVLRGVLSPAFGAPPNPLPAFQAGDVNYSHAAGYYGGDVPDPSVAVVLETLNVSGNPLITGWAGGTLAQTIEQIDLSECGLTKLAIGALAADGLTAAALGLVNVTLDLTGGGNASMTDGDAVLNDLVTLADSYGWTITVNLPMPEVTEETAEYEAAGPYSSVIPYTGTMPADFSIAAEVLVNINIFGQDGVTGTIAPIVACELLTQMNIEEMPLITGDAPEPPPNIVGYYITNCPGINGYAGGNFPASCHQVFINGCGLPEADIDAVLAAVLAGGATPGGPDLIMNLSGGTNAPPSASGLADKALLELAGWSVTVNT